MKGHWKLALWLRRALAVLLLLAQIAFWFLALTRNSEHFIIYQLLCQIVGVLIALRVIVKPGNAGYKFMWIVFIILLPIFGVPFYVLSALPNRTKHFGKRIAAIQNERKELFLLPQGEVHTTDLGTGTAFSYLQNHAGFPAYNDTQTAYFSCGEEFHTALLRELEKAQKYIFLEYFIIQEGKMWDPILEILLRKAAEGVRVRVLYDEIGCFLTLPVQYPRMLAKQGIECCKFNRFVPFLSTKQNNRDHRKIDVIEGALAFTGGCNLADEYINAIEKHGHWKDCAVLCRGSAAWSFTVMFLQMWELATGKKEDYRHYFPPNALQGTCEGSVQPYADSPMDADTVGTNVYLHVIHRARKYLWICTPYLIPDDTLMAALCLSAKSGVDVRIITPHKWDKLLVHATTRSYYGELIRAGVRIYEYTDGFMHAKTFVADDDTATVGTVNLDYRSLYLHFECGVLMQNTLAVTQVKEDFLRTLEHCTPITEKECRRALPIRILQGVLRLFAPLM
ncbi:MAG: cardiolipin synthase [Clostridia bacterium]|nr:cardiolipin synthase [Clostridia bacterium]